MSSFRYGRKATKKKEKKKPFLNNNDQELTLHARYFSKSHDNHLKLTATL